MQDAFPINDKDHLCCRRSEESTAPACSTAGPGYSKNGSFTLDRKWEMACKEWQRRRKGITKKPAGWEWACMGMYKFSRRHCENAHLPGPCITSSIKRESGTRLGILEYLKQQAPARNSWGQKNLGSREWHVSNVLSESWFIAPPPLNVP